MQATEVFWAEEMKDLIYSSKKLHSGSLRTKDSRGGGSRELPVRNFFFHVTVEPKPTISIVFITYDVLACIKSS